MRKHLRLAVIGVVVLLLGGLGFLVARSMVEQRQQELMQAGLDLLPEVAQRIQDFHRVETRDGRKVWEVAAREAQYLEERQEVVVKEPMVRLYMKDGRTVGLSGVAGRVRLAGREVRQVELDGAIELQFAGYVARTERAVYERTTDRISSPGAVEISGRELELKGDRMEVDVGAQRLRLFRNVTMTLQPEAANDRAAPK
jgi:LPS export ABC transporter protein LptC